MGSESRKQGRSKTCREMSLALGLHDGDDAAIGKSAIAGGRAVVDIRLLISEERQQWTDSPVGAFAATSGSSHRDARTGSAFATVSTTANIMGPFFRRPRSSLRMRWGSRAKRATTRDDSSVSGAARPSSHAARIEVNLGSLDAPDQLTPTYENWIVRRESWLPPFPLTRRYERNREGKGRFEE